MGFFEIQWRASTKKDLRAIPPHEVERIVAAVEKLSDEPFPYGFQKLMGAAHTYRIRIGDYRVIHPSLGFIVDSTNARFVGEALKPVFHHGYHG
jgi:mRNA interferase RelE/StbE